MTSDEMKERDEQRKKFLQEVEKKERKQKWDEYGIDEDDDNGMTAGDQMMHTFNVFTGKRSSSKSHVNSSIQNIDLSKQWIIEILESGKLPSSGGVASLTVINQITLKDL